MYERGVTLVELAIVLVIIGILVAVVAVGVNVRKSSDLQRFILDIQQYQVAVESFEQKYSELPGDMTDAYDLFSSCGSSAAECNGNGDGYIDYSNSDADNEALRFWQHLKLAGLVDGTFTGEGIAGGKEAQLNVNVPSSSTPNVGYMALYGHISGTKDRNELRIGGHTISDALVSAALSPHDAYTIDKKVDDGNPADGMVNGAEGIDVLANTCVNGGQYVATSQNVACVMSFPINP